MLRSTKLLNTGAPKEVVICYGWRDWKRQLEWVRQQKEDIQKVVVRPFQSKPKTAGGKAQREAWT